MLRIGFLPSDFNPMLLMLGDAEDFRALGGVMRSFARQPGDTRIDTMGFCATSNTAVVLTASDGPPGIHVQCGGVQGSGVQGGGVQGGGLLWRMDADRATGFAGQMDALADPGLLSGSEMLECSTEDEIPVKLSRGEYTDDFLVP